MKHWNWMIATALVMQTMGTSSRAATLEPVQPEQVPTGMEYKVSQPPIEDPRAFAGKRVAIFASHGVEESELTFPYEYLVQRGAQVDVLVPWWTADGIVASRYLKPTLFIHAANTFKAAQNTDYDLVVLTGGAWNAQVVRTDADALALVKRHSMLKSLLRQFAPEQLC